PVVSTLSLHDALPILGQDVSKADEPALQALIKKHNIEPKPGLGWGGLVAELFEELLQDTLVQPTFVLGHPVEVSPLARRRTSDPDRKSTRLNSSHRTI